MNLPDLSFLSRNEAPRDTVPARGDTGAARAQAPPAPGADHGSSDGRHAQGPQGELIEQLRAAQRELQTQNQELLYSQQAAESASERFEALFAGVPLSLMVLDEYDMVVQANAMAHRSFQPTEFDRPLTSLMPFVSDDDADRVHRAFAAARAQGRSDSAEVVFQIGNGRRITGDLHIAFIETQQGSGAPLRQFLCAVIDQGPLVAERQTLQQRNEQLHASERRLEAVINSALDAIICVDQHQRITVFNPTAAVLFQCPTHDALGSALARFFPDLQERAPAYALLTTQAALGEMQARTATGRTLAVEVNMTFEHHEGSTTTTVFARDLTARKKAESRRQELEVQLRESQKMQAVGTMAGGIAHDFNNILHAILGNVELAKADASAPGTDQRVLESLREIDKAARRARDLVRQILAFSRNEASQRHAVQLADLMRETERLVRVTLPKHVRLEVPTPARLPPILADATQVEQALLNLCTNAVQALGAGPGQVRMQAQVAWPDAPLRERLHLPRGACVALEVADDGPGMDADTRARIFEPFFTTKPVGQGTGLGLPVVHGVMRTHGGAIDVRTAPGQGCCFTLYFPLADEDEVQSVSRPAPLLPSMEPSLVPDAGKPCVMYVDDDHALVFLVHRLLGRRGCEVCGFTDPQAALAALAHEPERFDLLITDYNMPGFSGVELLRAARGIRPELPVALASGYITAEIEQTAMAEGARALIHKPNDVQELCNTVDQLIRGEL